MLCFAFSLPSTFIATIHIPTHRHPRYYPQQLQLHHTPTMLASALKAGRLSHVRNARGYASAAGKIGDKKVSMSPLETDRYINYQVRCSLDPPGFQSRGAFR